MPSIAYPPDGQRFVWTTFWNCDACSTGASKAGRESIVCKGNIAAYGRRTLPHETCGRWHSNVLSVAAYLNASDSRTHPERLPLLTFLLTSDAYEA